MKRTTASPCVAPARRWAAVLAGLLLALGLGSMARADGVPGPQRAIERLEGCKPKERRACVNILVRRKAGEGKLEIKAEVRGRRIIWYEYDKRSGSARRIN